MRTFFPNIHVRSFVRTFLELVDVWSVMRTETVQKSRSDPNADRNRRKSSVHKCQILAVLDGSDIRQGPSQPLPRPENIRKHIVQTGIVTSFMILGLCFKAVGTGGP